MDKNPNIWIIGPGPVGLYLSAKLSQHTCVTLITKKEMHVGAPIRVKGAQTFESSKLKICAFTNTESLESPDFIFLAVKASDIRECLARLVDYTCPIVILSNGINLETEYDTRKTTPLRAFCYFGVQRGSSSEILLAGKPRVEIEPNHSATEIIQNLFLKAGITSSVAADKKSAEWNKALVNMVINSIATTQRSENAIVLTGTYRALAESLYDEVAHVAKAEGAKIALKQDFFESLKPFASNRNSLLLDIETGRKTEIDFIQGRFVELANKHQLEVPIAKNLLQSLRNMELQIIETR